MRAPSGNERIEMFLSPAGAAYPILRPVVGFLANPMDSVTGDPEQLLAKAQAWRQAAASVAEIAEAEQLARMDLLAHWEGSAAQAFSAEMAQVNSSLHEIAEHYEQTAQVLEIASEGAAEAQSLVERIVRELIAWAIVTILVALASAYITAGASVIAGKVAVGVQAGLAGTRAAAVAVRLASILTRISKFLRDMSRFAKQYKITKIKEIGVKPWMTARFATADGYKLLATNWVIKQTIFKPALSPGLDRITDTEHQWKAPPL